MDPTKNLLLRVISIFRTTLPTMNLIIWENPPANYRWLIDGAFAVCTRACLRFVVLCAKSSETMREVHLAGDTCMSHEARVTCKPQSSSGCVLSKLERTRGESLSLCSWVTVPFELSWKILCKCRIIWSMLIDKITFAPFYVHLAILHYLNLESLLGLVIEITYVFKVFYFNIWN